MPIKLINDLRLPAISPRPVVEVAFQLRLTVLWGECAFFNRAPLARRAWLEDTTEGDGAAEMPMGEDSLVGEGASAGVTRGHGGARWAAAASAFSRSAAGACAACALTWSAAAAAAAFAWAAGASAAYLARI